MLKAVRKALGELSDVVSGNKQSSGGGNLNIIVLYKGNAVSFSEAVDEKTVGGKKLSVTVIAVSRMAIQLEQDFLLSPCLESQPPLFSAPLRL